MRRQHLFENTYRVRIACAAIDRAARRGGPNVIRFPLKRLIDAEAEHRTGGLYDKPIDRKKLASVRAFRPRAASAAALKPAAQEDAPGGREPARRAVSDPTKTERLIRG